MTFFPSMTMKKTLGIGRIVSERNILLKSTQKLRDGRRPLLDGKARKANGSETEKKHTTRSCSRGCRRSTKSI